MAKIPNNMLMILSPKNGRKISEIIYATVCRVQFIAPIHTKQTSP